MRISDWSSDVCSSDLVAVPEIETRTRGWHAVPLAIAAAILDDMLLVAELWRVHAAPAAGQFVLEEILFAQPRAFFQHQHRAAGLGQAQCHRAATGAAANHADIEIMAHVALLRHSIDRKSTRLNSSH